MTIGKARALQGIREGFLIELWVMPGAWNGANVDDGRGAMRFHESDEIIERPGGMANGQHQRARGIPLPFSCSPRFCGWSGCGRWHQKQYT